MTQNAPTSRSKFLGKLFEAVERGASKFEAQNARLGALGSTTPTTALNGRVDLGEGVWMDVEGDCGAQIEVSPGDGGQGVRIESKDRGSARWLTLAWSLPKEWIHEARYLGIYFEVESEGMVSFRPCIRYGYPNGFKDDFSAPTAVFMGGCDEHLTVFKPNRELLEGATAADIFLFMDGRRFDMTFRTIENIFV